MGANASRDIGNASNRSNRAKHTIEEHVDFGTTLPNGIYTNQQDYNIKSVRKLIMERKLSPFYKGLPDPPEVQAEAPTQSATKATSRPRNNSSCTQDQRRRTLYNNPVECPICFLYYPANINHSRCCDQPICTECFVQIKRPIETPTLPAACPFCLEDNYGVIYEVPAWSDRPRSPSSPPSSRSKVSPRHTTSGVSDSTMPRRKSINHNSPEVVLVDHIRPDWNEPPARPTPGRSRHNSESRGGGFFRAASPLFTRPGRSASSANHSEYQHYLSAMRHMNLDLEEYMVMEAIRMSLADQEQQQQQQSEQQNNNDATNNGDDDATSSQQQPRLASDNSQLITATPSPNDST
ncbi:hypothetical protein BJV82DRAFT_672997 [Fennellomyces sp. T-0311]|nr:hypothetical protein BJV82DRAFT_672997 [Fennellomyces sp. T-0311]